MSEQDLNKNVAGGPPADTEPSILRNEYGAATDPNVVIDEPGRTVMLTENETIIVEKEPHIDLPPANRPRKVYTGMWGPVELGVLGAAMLAVLGAILLYVFFVVPSNNEIENNRARRDKLDAELTSAKEKFGNISNVEHKVTELIDSVNTFEARFLPVPSTGRTALYHRINALIGSYGLVNSSGPDYSPLDIIDPSKRGEEEDRSGKAKFRSFFPGVYVTMTLDGPYTSLRRFIRDLETGSEFVVVSAVEIEPSDSQEAKSADETNAGQPGTPGTFGPGFDPTSQPMPMNTSVPLQTQTGSPNSSRGKTRGAVVSLRLEMAAYFRRPEIAPAAAEVPAPVTR
ncbi:MAG: hypothetical protein AB7F88_08055 [Pyrinomonadaceae bacterium]